MHWCVCARWHFCFDVFSLFSCVCVARCEFIGSNYSPDAQTYDESLLRRLRLSSNDYLWAAFTCNKHFGIEFIERFLVNWIFRWFRQSWRFANCLHRPKKMEALAVFSFHFRATLIGFNSLLRTHWPISTACCRLKAIPMAKMSTTVKRLKKNSRRRRRRNRFRLRNVYFTVGYFAVGQFARVQSQEGLEMMRQHRLRQQTILNPLTYSTIRFDSTMSEMIYHDKIKRDDDTRTSIGTLLELVLGNVSDALTENVINDRRK